MDLLIDFGVPVITALTSGIITYLVAAKTHNTKLEETKLTLEQEIEALEKTHENRMEELEKDLELQQKSKESDIVLDFAKDFMSSALADPSKLQDLKKLSDQVNSLKKKDTK